MSFYNLSTKEALQLLNVNTKTGLSQVEAENRLNKFGYNELESHKGPTLIVRFFAQFSDFMIIVLICAAVISFLVSLAKGEADYIDPVIIFAIILLNAILGVIQEAKAERSLEALKKMAAPNAIVKRDGKQMTIPSRELVPGDFIFLETGHYVPADARLVTTVNLKADESSMTGESHPAEKDASLVLKEKTSLGDRLNMVFSSSLITYGRGTAVVTATGMHTEVGTIAKMILTDQTPDTPLQKRLAKTGKFLGIAALSICVVIFLVGTIQGRGIFDMFMTSVSLAVAAIPEGLPAIVTIMLSLGVTRMARQKAIIRKLPAVETLGSATFICSDKTGTLTQNVMTVTEIATLNGMQKEGSLNLTEMLKCAALCNDASYDGNTNEITGDPTEAALLGIANKAQIRKSSLESEYPRIREIPFDSSRKLMTTVHLLPDGRYLSVTKGAFDVLIKHCTHVKSNGKTIPCLHSEQNRLERYCLSMSERALRVIAVACKYINRPIAYVTDENLEEDLTFLGMFGMIDPPRPEVKEAVSTCLGAGITPVMITGDHINTAVAIASQLGILTKEMKDCAITGAQLDLMDDRELENKIYQYRVFARVSPTHKVRIVKALQKRGEIVAMTGDGVNDAPALKTADIGCAMGLSGTDVAKNAADMILADDNFATIVSAVKEGRGIYENIRKSIHFLLSSNIGEIITIFLAILFGMPAPLVAVQLLWVNLVTDSLPAIALGVEPAPDDIMLKKPNSPKKGIFSDGLIGQILIEGVLIGSLALTAYVLGGRTMAFSVLSLSQLFHAFNMRSEHSIFKIGLFSNPKMIYSFLICTAMQIAVISIPALTVVFKVNTLDPAQWLTVFGLSIVPIIVVELQKFCNHK